MASTLLRIIISCYMIYKLATIMVLEFFASQKPGRIGIGKVR
jgi:hypothetical protein